MPQGIPPKPDRGRDGDNHADHMDYTDLSGLGWRRTAFREVFDEGGVPRWRLANKFWSSTKCKEYYLSWGEKVSLEKRLQLNQKEILLRFLDRLASPCCLNGYVAIFLFIGSVGFTIIGAIIGFNVGGIILMCLAGFVCLPWGGTSAMMILVWNWKTRDLERVLEQEARERMRLQEDLDEWSRELREERMKQNHKMHPRQIPRGPFI
jgi:hypothetical protein